MFKGLRNIILFLLCDFFAGCSWCLWNTQRRFVASCSDIKLPNEQIFLDTLVNVNGYFCNFIQSAVAESVGKIFFYKDGSVTMTGEGHEKGVYKISNDTIIANMYSFWGPIFKRWWLQTYTFKVMNRDTLKLLEIACKDVRYEGYIYSWFTDSIYTFHETDSIPPPSTYMRKRKWMWHDKRDWKQWMDEHGYKH